MQACARGVRTADFEMPDRKAFLLRIDPTLLTAVQRWADDDLRSLNAQIEFLLRRTLREAGRLSDPPAKAGKPPRQPRG